MPALGNITFYAEDPRALAHFWSDVFGYPHPRVGRTGEGAAARRGADGSRPRHPVPSPKTPRAFGPRLFFHHADGPKEGRNRLHLDVSVKPKAGAAGTTVEELDAEKDRLVALGAEVVRLVEQSWGPWPERYWQMRDPEGNEFCLQ